MAERRALVTNKNSLRKLRKNKDLKTVQIIRRKQTDPSSKLLSESLNHLRTICLVLDSTKMKIRLPQKANKKPRNHMLIAEILDANR